MKKMNDITECSGRPGILKVKVDGVLEPLAFKDKERTHPMVCACECKANDLMVGFSMALLASGFKRMLNGEGKLPDIPDTNDFFYVYVDEEPAGLDADASAFAGATDEFINKIK